MSADVYERNEVGGRPQGPSSDIPPTPGQHPMPQDNNALVSSDEVKRISKDADRNSRREGGDLNYCKKDPKIDEEVAGLMEAEVLEEKEVQEHEWEDDEIPYDSFSMLYVAENWKESVMPIGVFCLQMLILVLIAINLLQKNDRAIVTPLNIPVNVDTSVRISQYIACLVSVFTADDFVSGMLYIGKTVQRSSYSPVNEENGERRLPKHVRAKWEITNALRVIEGALVIIVSFIFIVQSFEAIELWLNFAGVTFVGMLDDTAFHLAKHRFLGDTARKVAYKVYGVRVTYPEGGEKRMNIARSVLFVGITLVTWILLSVVVVNQVNMAFVCTSLTLEVGGDTKIQIMRYLSGTYNLEKSLSIYGRPVYVQAQGRGAFIAYCSGPNRWTMSELKDDESNLNKPCDEFEMQSERTRSFDIADVQSLLFSTGDDADATIKCNNCHPNRNEDCSYGQGECNPMTRLCDCKKYHFGDSCQFKGPCTEMIMDEGNEFPGEINEWGNFLYQRSYDLLYLDNKKPVFTYDRPVYAQESSKSVIYYDGGRYVMGVENDFETYQENGTGSFAEYLSEDFNANTHYNDLYYVSDPTSLESPMSTTFRAWLTDSTGGSTVGKLGSEEFELQCADCKDDYESGISNCVDSSGIVDYEICKPTTHELHGTVQRCDCPPGYKGPLCHIRPVEGTGTLYLDHSSAAGVCSVCGKDNMWTLWNLDGAANGTSCVSFPSSNEPLVFASKEERRVGLHLNTTHFSVVVSSNGEITTDTLCQEGTEIYSINRNVSDEQIKIETAIHINSTGHAEMVDPEQVNCVAETEVEQEMCFLNLTQVYSTPYTESPTLYWNSSLQNVWLLLDIKITGIKV